MTTLFDEAPDKRSVMLTSKMLALFLLLSGSSISHATNALMPSQIVPTQYGPVKGISMPIGNKTVYVFKNIPYAKPPVENLRFQPPEELSSWTNIEEIDQNREESACPQLTYYPSGSATRNEIGTEDCLLLDVYSNKIPSKNSEAFSPVIVYFHGGKFVRGHKDEYVPSSLMLAGDMVVVIPNYRLGILGFWSTANTDIPGNIGLLDQRMALKWVHENIALFGGNPSKITIAGHGAGGASVGLHLLSKPSFAYISSAISASGTALDPWVLQRPSRSEAMLVGKYCSCPTSTNKDMIECLRNTPVFKLISVQEEYKNLSFGPVYDGQWTSHPFLSDWPLRLYQRKQFAKVPYLAGVTRDEASIEFYRKFFEASMYGNLDKMLAHYLQPYLKHLPNTESVVKAAKYHYLRGIAVPSYLSTAKYFINLLSDFLYKCSLQEVLKFHSEAVQDTWMYVFQFQGNVSLGDALGPLEYKRNFGVSHMEDVVYLFNTSFVPFFGIRKNKKSVTMEERLSKIWRTFAAFGKASTSPKWPRYNTLNMSYLEIGNTMTVKTHYRQYEMDFWTVLVPELITAPDPRGESSHQVRDELPKSATWGMAGVAIILAVLCVALAAGVVVARKRIMRNCSVPVCTSHGISRKLSSAL